MAIIALPSRFDRLEPSISRRRFWGIGEIGNDGELLVEYEVIIAEIVAQDSLKIACGAGVCAIGKSGGRFGIARGAGVCAMGKREGGFGFGIARGARVCAMGKIGGGIERIGGRWVLFERRRVVGMWIDALAKGVIGIKPRDGAVSVAPCDRELVFEDVGHERDGLFFARRQIFSIHRVERPIGECPKAHLAQKGSDLFEFFIRRGMGGVRGIADRWGLRSGMRFSGYAKLLGQNASDCSGTQP